MSLSASGDDQAAVSGPSAAPAGGTPRVWTETFGCQMNVLDTELVQRALVAQGFSHAPSPTDCEVLLINTCSVRERSEQKVWSMLGRLGRRAEDNMPVVGVMGCMAERQAEQIRKRMPHVSIICGPGRLDALPAMLASARQRRAVGPQVAVTGPRRGVLAADGDGIEQLDRARAISAERRGPQAFVRITRGCNKFCSFCVVPHTRGAEVHRPPHDVVDEVHRLVERGVVEVTLLGQTVNHYQHGSGAAAVTFAQLLRQVHDQVPRLQRLRFLTSYPRDFGDDALLAMAQCPRICRYLHVPAQSGSDRVLKAMNRGYTVAGYLGLVARARQMMPDICLSGDMIAGFPGETDEDQAASVDLLRAVRYKSCFIFKYSPRSGTVAARRFADQDHPETLIKARHKALLAVQADISGAHHRALCGRSLRVLVEKESSLGAQSTPVVKLGWRAGGEPWVRLVGRTQGDEIVAFDGPRRAVGRQVMVEAVSATHLSVLGRMLPGALELA